MNTDPTASRTRHGPNGRQASTERDKRLVGDGKRRVVKRVTPARLAAVGLLLLTVAGPTAALTTPPSYTVGIDGGFPGLRGENLSSADRELLRSAQTGVVNLSAEEYPSAFETPDVDEREEFLVELDGGVFVAIAESTQGLIQLSLVDRTDDVLRVDSELSPTTRAALDRARNENGRVYGQRPDALTDGLSLGLLYPTTDVFVLGDRYLTVSVTTPFSFVPPVGHWLATVGVYAGALALVPAATARARQRLGTFAGWVAGVAAVFCPVAAADPAVAYALPLDVLTVTRLTERLPRAAAVAVLAATAWIAWQER